MEGDSIKYIHSRNYSRAVFLILVGGMLLLNSIGVVDWGVWVYIFRFWPILIVLIGLRIILGNSSFSRFLGMFFTMVLTLASFVVGYIQYTQQPITFLPPVVNDWVLKGGSGIFNLNKELLLKDEEISFEQYSDILERVLSIETGACTFNLSEEDSDRYFAVKSKYPKGFKDPLLVHSKSLDVLDIDFKGAQSQNFELFYTNSEYDMTIGHLDIISDLDIKLGAGNGNVILEETPVKDFWAEVGAGKLDLQIGVKSVPQGETKLTVGAGKMNLILPSRVGYVLEYDLGVGNITVNGDSVSEITGGRGKYTSENYVASDIQLTIYVNVGVGSFNIESN